MRRIIGFSFCIFLVCIFLVMLISGCGLHRLISPKQKQDAILEPAQEATHEAIEEYAMMNQISDLEVAKFYLTHPNYAEKNPYRPTDEDIAFYETMFFKAVYPDFDKLVEKYGFQRAKTYWMIGYSKGFKAKYAVEEKLKKSELIEDAFINAKNFYEGGEMDKALKSMLKAVELQPDSITLQYDLGVLYMKKGERYNAINCFKTSINLLKGTGHTNLNIRIHPKVYIGASNNLALMYMSMNMYNEAVGVLVDVVKFAPDDLDSSWNLAITYYSMGETEKTIPQMRKYILLDPNNDEAHEIIGILYYQSELYEAALDEFRIAKKLASYNKKYYHDEGLALAQLKRYGEAILAFKKASGFDEGEEFRRTFIEQYAANQWRTLYNDGCTAMEGRDYSRAVTLFKSVLEVKPDMAEAHINLGYVYKLLGDTQKQIYYLNEAVRLKPDMPEVHYNLGLAYSEVGMYTEAIAKFKKAIELNPSFIDAHFVLGTMQYKFGNYADAIIEFSKCIELSPNYFEAYLNLGSCCMKTGDLNSAISYFDKATKLKSNSAEAYYNLGIVYMKMKKLDLASTLFQKALEIEPRHSQSKAMLKEIEDYQKQGDNANVKPDR